MITGFFHPLRPPHPYIPVVVGNRNAPTIPFLLDTGATRSILAPVDASAAFGLSWRDLTDDASRTVRIEGLGGGIRAAHVRTLLHFREDTGAIRAVPNSVLVPLDADRVAGLPSILGWDVLDAFSIHLDRGRRLVTLEILRDR